MKEVIKVRALALDGRRKIEMMWGENASTVKIAAELGISQCTVYTELKRGRYVRAGVDVELDKYVLNQHILPYIGGCRLRDITPMQIQSIIAVLSDKSNSLQPKVLVNLRSIFNAAHILRHTYITRLFEAGLAVKEIQYLTGHSTMDMTLKVYTHYDRRSREAKTAEKVRSALSGQHIKISRRFKAQLPQKISRQNTSVEAKTAPEPQKPLYQPRRNG